MTSQMNEELLVKYLETRVEALDNLIKTHNAKTGNYLVYERAICLMQIDIITGVNN